MTPWLKQLREAERKLAAPQAPVDLWEHFVLGLVAVVNGMTPLPMPLDLSEMMEREAFHRYRELIELLQTMHYRFSPRQTRRGQLHSYVIKQQDNLKA